MMEGIDAASAAAASGGSGGLVAGIIALVHKYLADRKAEQREKEVNEKFEKIEDKLDAHKLYSAQNFVTQEGLGRALEPVISQLERMEGKIDRLKDTKADKE